MGVAHMSPVVALFGHAAVVALCPLLGLSGKHLPAPIISPSDPGRVKTRTSRECAELFSLLSSFDSD
jgi:hypothetical protein